MIVGQLSAISYGNILHMKYYQACIRDGGVLYLTILSVAKIT